MFGFGKKKPSANVSTSAAPKLAAKGSTGSENSKAALIAQAQAARKQAQTAIANMPAAQRQAMEKAIADLAKAAEVKRNIQAAGAKSVQELAARHPEAAAKTLRGYMNEKK